MKLSIIVHTWDPYEDCWNPFFILFKKYWPNFDGTIYLNTENKDYTFNGLNVVSLKVGEGDSSHSLPLAWSERLEKGLKKIDDDIILYMQEDYFFKNYVNSDLIEKYYNLIKNNLDIDCIHLTDQGTPPMLTSEKRDNLYLANPSDRYYINGQAALWRRSSILKCLKPSESGWELEEFGSRRAKYLNLKIYTPDRSFIKKDIFEITPYIFTGIIRGQWHKDVPKLFNENNITIDFSQRGISTGKMNVKIIDRIRSRIKHTILQIICIKDIFVLKYFQQKKKNDNS